MANGPTLPPQAYTREILTSAFNWLQSQPESVKKLATTPDALVGLYMRAQRFGASSLEADAPVSSVSFMSDLKNLAEGLKQFEDHRERRIAQTQTANISASRPAPQPASNFSGGPVSGHLPNHFSGNWAGGSGPSSNVDSNFASTIAQGQSHASQQYLTQQYAQPQYVPSPVAPVPTGLTERSLQMIHEVKASLNLSNDSDAINLMLALAYKNLDKLLE